MERRMYFGAADPSMWNDLFLPMAHELLVFSHCERLQQRTSIAPQAAIAHVVTNTSVTIELSFVIYL